MRIAKKMLGKAGVMVAMVLGLSVGSASTAHAAMILTLFDGTNTVSVTDGALNDINPTTGAITWLGSIGVVWSVNVSTGISTPVLGSATNPSMDLNSVDVSTGAGTLTITLSDTGFSYTGGAALAIGGTQLPAGSSLSYTAAGTTLGPFFGGAFSATGGGTLAPGTISQVVTVTHTGAGLTSFDAGLTAVPEPASMTLLGMGLLGLGARARRRLKK